MAQQQEAVIPGRKERPGAAARTRAVEPEHASHHCPRCSAKLEPRKCKMICNECGYYMSCSDFY